MQALHLEKTQLNLHSFVCTGNISEPPLEVSMHFIMSLFDQEIPFTNIQKKYIKCLKGKCMKDLQSRIRKQNSAK